jgi:hypothetical protein
MIKLSMNSDLLQCIIANEMTSGLPAVCDRYSRQARFATIHQSAPVLDNVSGKTCTCGNACVHITRYKIFSKKGGIETVAGGGGIDHAADGSGRNDLRSFSVATITSCGPFLTTIIFAPALQDSDPRSPMGSCRQSALPRPQRTALQEITQACCLSNAIPHGLRIFPKTRPEIGIEGGPGPFLACGSKGRQERLAAFR